MAPRSAGGVGFPVQHLPRLTNDPTHCVVGMRSTSAIVPAEDSCGSSATSAAWSPVADSASEPLKQFPQLASGTIPGQFQKPAPCASRTERSGPRPDWRRDGFPSPRPPRRSSPPAFRRGDAFPGRHRPARPHVKCIRGGNDDRFTPGAPPPVRGSQFRSILFRSLCQQVFPPRTKRHYLRLLTLPDLRPVGRPDKTGRAQNPYSEGRICHGSPFSAPIRAGPLSNAACPSLPRHERGFIVQKVDLEFPVPRVLPRDPPATSPLPHVNSPSPLVSARRRRGVVICASSAGSSGEPRSPSTT